MPQLCPAAQGVQPAQMGFRFVGDDLHRQRAASAQPRHHFGFVHNDDKAFGVNLNHLLAQQGASQAFDQVQAGVHFVRPIYGQIESWLAARVR